MTEGDLYVALIVNIIFYSLIAFGLGYWLGWRRGQKD